MTTIDEEPGLNKLIVEGVVSRLTNRRKKYLDAYTEMTKDLLEDILAAITVVFNIHPEIQAVGFGFTEGEYNDQTYDGFSVRDAEVKFTAGILPWGQDVDGMVTNDMEWYGAWSMSDTYSQAVAIFEYVCSTLQLAADWTASRWGAGTRLVFTREGLQTESYEYG